MSDHLPAYRYSNRIAKILPRYMLITAWENGGYIGESFGLRCGGDLSAAIQFAKRMSTPNEYWEIVDCWSNNTVATSDSVRKDRDGH